MSAGRNEREVWWGRQDDEKICPPEREFDAPIHRKDVCGPHVPSTKDEKKKQLRGASARMSELETLTKKYSLGQKGAQ